MAQKYDFTIKAGATAPPLRWGIENENNSAVNITGAKGATFYMRSVGGGSNIVNGVAMTITDSVYGLLQFSPTTQSTSGYDATNVFVDVYVTLSDNTLLKLPDDGFSIRGRIVSALG